MIDNAINITANLMKLSSESLKIFNGCMRNVTLDRRFYEIVNQIQK